MNRAICKMPSAVRVISVVILTAAVWPIRTTQAESLAKPVYVGTHSCSAVACHGRTDPHPAAGAVAGNEFVIWMHTDPHSHSAATIWGKEFELIMSRLRASRDHAWDLDVYSRCARCHDPSYDSRVSRSSASVSAFVPVSKMEPRGIGCESCHGPAGNWLAQHYQRGIARSQLSALGMNNLQNLLVRSRACAACHVGSAENDMNHDMIAAGHPPLRFEAASYHDRLAKHWPAVHERQATPDFQAQLWAAGQFAAADAALQLLHGRAHRAATSVKKSDGQKEEGEAPAEPIVEPRVGSTLPLPSTSTGPTSPWPEFSEYSCFSCHQRLRTAEENRRLRLGSDRLSSPGQPVWNPWFFAMPPQSTPDNSADIGPASSAAWKTLQAHMQQLSSTNASEIAGFVQATRAQVIADYSYLGNAQVGHSIVSFTNRDLTRTIRHAAPRAQNWEAICQLFLALQAASRGYQDAVSRKGVGSLFRDNIHPMSDRHHSEKDSRPLLSTMGIPWQSDLESIRWSLAFAEETDVPRAMLRKKPLAARDAKAAEVLPSHVRIMTLDEIRQLAVRLAEQIDERWSRLEGSSR